LDQEAWDNLNRYHPVIAGQIQEAVQDGQTPADVRRYVMEHTYKWELAHWCEQAARHLESEG
jgi:hypothetical protein